MIQILETTLWTYSNPNWDNWSGLLKPFMLVYNNVTHSTTGFVPAFLLTPLTAGQSLHPSDNHVNRVALANHPQSQLEQTGHLLPIPPELMIESDHTDVFVSQFETF